MDTNIRFGKDLGKYFISNYQFACNIKSKTNTQYNWYHDNTWLLTLLSFDRYTYCEIDTLEGSILPYVHRSSYIDDSERWTYKRLTIEI